MATRLKDVDAVMVGMGWTGSILARELTKAGLSVVGLERGPERVPGHDFVIPSIRDELRFGRRPELFQDSSLDTITVRHFPGEEALPMRRWGAFSPGEGVGGAGVHWTGHHWRFLPDDFVLKSKTVARYGRQSIPDDMTMEDWGVSYDELEPHFDRFDKLCGTSGQAGNLRGQIIEGGNPFEGPRSNEYPNKPLKQSLAGELFEKAAKGLGYHPFPLAASNASAPYVNSEGLQIGACQYCGFCTRYGCEANAKASPNICVMPVLRGDPKFELRTLAYATRLIYDKAGKKVQGVVYVDMRTGEEFEQPANLVVLCGYVFSNTQFLLLAGIGEPYDPATGKGAVGRNYCYQTQAGVDAFFEDKFFNPFMQAGGSHTGIDDFNSDNFDHAGLGFHGGGYISCTANGVQPIGGRLLPRGTPSWGAQWKRDFVKWYGRSVRFATQGCGYASKANFLDLDPTYKDVFGRSLIRMTYNDTDDAQKMSTYLLTKCRQIAEAMGPTSIQVRARPKLFHTVPGQSTHNTGGTIMGTDPKTTVVNKYLQSWDAHNLFVMGASVFPQNAGYNPTGTVGALAYWAAHAITTRYLKSPGPLVPA
jgi:gluconate 2-dehydrogenase alpha chain